MVLPLLLALLVPPSGLPPLPREFRAAWVATVDNIDWPTRRGESTETERRELLTILDKAKAIHLNALILQVRPSADALYRSDYEPWSEYLTGRQGKAPDPLWDPLEFACTEAHKRGIELHAWFNPYRAMSPAQHGPNADSHISRAHPEVVRSYGKSLWMDPGEPLVREHTLNVMLDVLKRYDVDGIHIDDYFYPYRDEAKDKAHADFPDSRSFDRYLASRGSMHRDDWRRNNVNQFIETLYHEIKREKPWVKFGISPFGIYRPGVPKGIVAGVDQYSELYADAKRWLNEGWCDYFTPQLYWPVSQTAQAYGTLLNWWIGENAKGRHIWPGNFTGKVEPGTGKWSVSEVLDQITATRSTHSRFETSFSSGAGPGAEREEGSTGNVHFSFKVFLHDAKKIDEALLVGPYNELAAVPSSPWLARGKPPVLSVHGGKIHASTPVETYYWSAATKSGWTGWETGDSEALFEAARVDRLAVVGVDRYGRASTPVRYSRL